MAQEKFDIRKLIERTDNPDYFDLLKDVPSIEEPSQELAGKIFELVSSAAEKNFPLGLAGGHVYTRKGYLNIDVLGGTRNPSYASASDDVLLQITVQVPAKQAQELIELAATAIEDRAAAALKAEREALELRRSEIDSQIAALGSR